MDALAGIAVGSIRSRRHPPATATQNSAAVERSAEAPVMNPSVRLVLLFHNHQPVGNFDGVFEQAYQDSYLPFLEVFERYEHLKIGLHTSGPLVEWLDAHHG